LIVAILAILSVLVALVAFLFIANSALTPYVNGPKFRAELEKETAKGLHFPATIFAPIYRTGALTAKSEGAIARDGRKAMTTLQARGITARFNPAGIFLRRWQIDDLHVDRAEIGIRVYEPRPEPSPAKPWYAIFLPDRVYLKYVWSNDADVTWRMRGEKGGVFNTHLVVTPHGRDFEYDATEGTLRNAMIPELRLQHTHLLITKTFFQLNALDLQSGRGTIHAKGTAATRGDKNIDFSFKWKDLSLQEWLPARQRDNFKGSVDGELEWKGRDYKLDSANMTGAIRVDHGEVVGLSLLEQIAVLTGRPELRALQLNECAARLKLKNSDWRISDIAIEQKEKFRLEGEITLKKESLGGALRLGIARSYLDWLPHPEEVFPREAGGYLWTTFHLRGTLESPQQDLSPRILGALKGNPWAFLTVALREFAAWLNNKGD
jgi:hypothetical protein